MLLSRTYLWFAFSVAVVPLWPTAAVGAPVSPQSDVFVTLRPAAEVKHRTVLLGDVATIAVRIPAEQQEWSALEIARPESFATPVHLTRAAIADRLASLRPEWRGRLYWGGSEEVVVSGQSQQFDLEPAVSKAAIFLLERLGGKDRVTLRVEEGSGKISIPFGVVHCRPDLQAANFLGAYAEVPLLLDVDGKPVTRQLVRFAVLRAPRRAAQAESGVQVQATDVPDAGAQVQVHASPYLVARQKPVTLLLDMEGIRIESEGIALDNARLGDVVRVRRANGNAELAGKVVREGVVQVGEN